MDLDIKCEALNQAVAIAIAETNNGRDVTNEGLVALAKDLEAYLTGGDSK